MYAMHDLKNIATIEQAFGERRVVIILFVKPSDAGAKDIIAQFNYYHNLANKFCSVYAAGFGKDIDMAEYFDKLAQPGVDGKPWFYSDKCFVNVTSDIEKRLPSWSDTGEMQLLMLQTKPESPNILNFQNYVSLDLAHGLRQNYFESIPRIITALIKSSKKEVTALATLKDTRKRISLRTVLEKGIDFINPLPTPAKEILKDNLFYKTSVKNN